MATVQSTAAFVRLANPRVFECCDCGTSGTHSGVRGKTPLRCDPCGSAHREHQTKNRPKPLFSSTCGECGSTFERPWRSGEFCSPKCSATYAGRKRHKFYDCRQCGKTFYPKAYDRTSFCSRECYFIASAQASGRSRERQKAKRAAARAHKTMATRVYFLTCKFCIAMFTSRSAHRRYCSNRCNCAALIMGREPGKYRERQCPECQHTFTPPYGRAHSRFCCRECSRRHAGRISRSRRRSRERGAASESVDPIQVFKRDRWQCQKCGTRTLRSRRGTHDPRAPELDHIIPLSVGGEHSYRNTQCLCRACNHAKGARPLGQLRLFG